MPASLLELKKALRLQCRETRKALGREGRELAGQAICTHIEAWPAFQQADVILTYLPMRGEVDLLPLLERRPEKRWLVPRVLPEENHRMAFHPYDPARLVRHEYGMLEPAADLPEIPPAEVQISLVPGLAYDRQGWRLGYGGGYFDRFLKDFTGTSLGIIYQALLVESIPHGERDVPVIWIVTENGIFEAMKGKNHLLQDLPGHDRPGKHKNF